MRYTTLVLLPTLITLGSVLAQTNGDSDPELSETGCVLCHLPEYGRYKKDIHFTKSDMLCSSCHGGDDRSNDADSAMYLTRRWRGAPSIPEIARFCGRCHEAVFDSYKTSDGARIAGLDEMQIPKPKPSVKLERKAGQWLACVSCHGDHGIEKASFNLLNQVATRYPRVALADSLAQILELSTEIVRAARLEINNLTTGRLFLNPNCSVRLSAGEDLLKELRIVQHTQDVDSIAAKSSELRSHFAELNKDLYQVTQSRADQLSTLPWIWGYVLLLVIVASLKLRQIRRRERSP